MPPPPEYIRFYIEGVDASERLRTLRAILKRIRAAKSVHPARQVDLADEDNWRAFFPSKALATFEPADDPGGWVPHEPLERGWDFESMLSAVLMAEYELGDVVRVNMSEAELRFIALAWPYGGAASLVRLIEAFGFRVSCMDVGMGLVRRGDY